MYIKVQNELTAAYNELRDEFAVQYFERNYEELSEDEQKKVRKVYPNHISEATPRNIN